MVQVKYHKGIAFFDNIVYSTDSFNSNAKKGSIPMGERIQRLKDNKNRFIAGATIALGAFTLTACGGSEVSATSTPNTDRPVATSTTHPGTTETTKPTETKSSTPSKSETQSTTSLHGYEAVLTKAVPQKQSYMDTIPALNAANQKLMDMKVIDYVNVPTSEQIAFRKAVAPDEIIHQWSKDTNSLNYTIPSDHMTALQIVNNFFALQEYGANKVGISGTPDQGGPVINSGVVAKMIAAEYYKPGGKTADGSLTNVSEDFFSADKSIISLNKMQAPNMLNSTVLEVKDLGTSGFSPDGHPEISVPQIHVYIKGEDWYKKPFNQEYSFADITGKGDWVVTSHAMLDGSEQYNLMQGTVEKNL